PAPPVERVLVVYPAVPDPQTIDFPPIPAQTLGNLPIKLAATATSGLPVSFTSSNPAIVSIQDNFAILHAVGGVNITAAQPGNPGYEAANPVPQALTIHPVSGQLDLHPDPIEITVRSGERASVPIV